MTNAVPPRDVWVPVALELIAEGGWASFTLGDLAQALGVTPAAFYAHCGSRQDFLCHIMTFADDQTAAVYNAPTDLPAPERLLEILLCRLEVMNSHKKALESIARHMAAPSLSDKEMIPCLAMRGMESLSFLLDRASIPISPLARYLLAPYLGFILYDPLMVWFQDDTSDLAQTMAALDHAITRVPDFLWAHLGTV